MYDRWPASLAPGTPWSLTLAFDSNTPGRQITIGGTVSDCFAYRTTGASLTLGGFRYSQPGGTIQTNTQIPEIGCTGGPGFSHIPRGLTTFYTGTRWTSDDPGAWNLNLPGSGIFRASYYEAIVTDGGLPLVPTLAATQAMYAGLQYDTGAGGPFAQFTSNFRPVALTQPSAVPEPATLTLFSAGLAAALAARRRRKL